MPKETKAEAPPELNETQKEVLESFFGTEGTYLELIKESTILDTGTKIMYLERAISEDCDSFLKYLDKLYNPKLKGKEGEEQLELIRALKMLNDLCFNNDVKYGNYGIKNALNHYFHGLGTINPEAFHKSIQGMIKKELVEIEKGQSVKVKRERFTRAALEIETAPQNGWRALLDMPSEQLNRRQIVESSMVQYLKDILEINEDLRPTSEAQTRIIEELKLLMVNAPFMFRRMGAQQNFAEELINLIIALINPEDPDHAKNFLSLLEGNIPFAELFKLDYITRTLLISQSEGILQLTKAGIPFKALIKLQHYQFQLLDHPEKTLNVLRKFNIAWKDLLVFDSDELDNLMNGSVEQLIEKLNKPFQDILATQPQFISRAFDYLSLNEAGFSWDELATNKDIHDLLLTQSYSLLRLVKEVGMPLEKVLTLNRDMLNSVLLHSKKMLQLVQAGIPWEELINEDFFSEYYDFNSRYQRPSIYHAEEIAALVQQGVPFEKLKNSEVMNVKIIVRDSQFAIALMKNVGIGWDDLLTDPNLEFLLDHAFAICELNQVGLSLQTLLACSSSERELLLDNTPEIARVAKQNLIQIETLLSMVKALAEENKIIPMEYLEKIVQFSNMISIPWEQVFQDFSFEEEFEEKFYVLLTILDSPEAVQKLISEGISLKELFEFKDLLPYLLAAPDANAIQQLKALKQIVPDLSNQQHEFLKASISEPKAVMKLNPDTNLIYFQKALYEDPSSFLDSLDRLYNPELKIDEYQNQIKLLDTLILVNKASLYNQDEQSEELQRIFRAGIEALIRAQLDILQKKYPVNLKEQKLEQEPANKEWRLILGLATDPLDPIQINRAKTLALFNQVVEGKYYLESQLMPYRKAIAHGLLDTKAHSEHELERFVNKLSDFAPNLLHLHNEGQIEFSDLLDLEDDLLKKDQYIVYFIKLGAEFKDLVSNPTMKNILRTCPGEVLDLHENYNILFTDLLKIGEEQIHLLIEPEQTILPLIDDLGISLDFLLELNPAVRFTLLSFANQTVSLIQAGQYSTEELINILMEPERLSVLNQVFHYDEEGKPMESKPESNIEDASNLQTQLQAFFDDPQSPEGQAFLNLGSNLNSGLR